MGHPAAAPETGQRRRRKPWRVAAGIVSDLLLTAGFVILLLAIYQLWWTNVASAAAADAERQELLAQWQQPATVQPLPEPSVESPQSEPKYGVPFALLYIPRLKAQVWGLPISQGIGKDVLATGAGHYPGTAMPGEVGNFAIAAHRATHGEPFAYFPDLREGDKVYVQTSDWWYTYRLTHDEPNLTPSDTWVIHPVPGQPDATPTQRLITMTTCTPRYGSTGRWAWFGELVSTSPAQTPPDGISV